MPTYAYACTACDHRFEFQQSFTDDALTACPRCDGRVRKLFNSVGIVFKGSGFYRTDSRTAGEPAATKAGAEGSDTGNTQTADTTAGSSSGGTGGQGSSGGSDSSGGPGPTKDPAPAKGAGSANGSGSSGSTSAATSAA